MTQEKIPFNWELYQTGEYDAVWVDENDNYHRADVISVMKRNKYAKKIKGDIFLIKIK